MAKRQGPDADSPEMKLSKDALQHGYKWDAAGLNIDEQQELSLSLHAALGPSHTRRTPAEVVQIV